MSRKLRFVFDTSVLVSALLFEDSPPGRAFFATRSRGSFLMSSPTIEELANVLKRSKFDRYLTEQERDAFLDRLVRTAEVVTGLEEIVACRDPKDDKFLALAVHGKSDYLVTGDHDLLVLNPFRNVLIVSPARLLELLAISNPACPIAAS